MGGAAGGVGGHVVGDGGQVFVNESAEQAQVCVAFILGSLAQRGDGLQGGAGGAGRLAGGLLLAAQDLGVLFGPPELLGGGFPVCAEFFVLGSVQGAHFGDRGGFFLRGPQCFVCLLSGQGAALAEGFGLLRVVVGPLGEVGDTARCVGPCLSVTGQLVDGSLVGLQALRLGGKEAAVGQGCGPVEGAQCVADGFAGLLVTVSGFDDVGAGLVQCLFGAVLVPLGSLGLGDLLSGEGCLFGVGGFLGGGCLRPCLLAALGDDGLVCAECLGVGGCGGGLVFGFLGVLVFACEGRHAGGACGLCGVQGGQGVLEGEAGVCQELCGAALGVVGGLSPAGNVLAGVQESAGRRKVVALGVRVSDVLAAAGQFVLCVVLEVAGCCQVLFEAGHVLLAGPLPGGAADEGRPVAVRGAGGKDPVGQLSRGHVAARGVQGNGG